MQSMFINMIDILRMSVFSHLYEQYHFVYGDEGSFSELEKFGRLPYITSKGKVIKIKS